MSKKPLKIKGHKKQKKASRDWPFERTYKGGVYHAILNEDGSCEVEFPNGQTKLFGNAGKAAKEIIGKDTPINGRKFFGMPSTGTRGGRRPRSGHGVKTTTPADPRLGGLLNGETATKEHDGKEYVLSWNGEKYAVACGKKRGSFDSIDETAAHVSGKKQNGAKWWGLHPTFDFGIDPWAVVAEFAAFELKKDKPPKLLKQIIAKARVADRETVQKCADLLTALDFAQREKASHRAPATAIVEPAGEEAAASA